MKPRQFASALLAVFRGSSGFAAVAQTGVATVFVLGVNVVTGIISARLLGAHGRGELSALLLSPQVLSFLFTLGLPVALIVKTKQSPERAAGLAGAALVLSLIMGVAAVIVGYLALPHLMTQYDAAAIGVARGLLAFVFLGVASTVLVAALQLRDRFLIYNRIRGWQSVLVLAALVLLALFGAFDSTSAALAYLVPTLPFFAWNAWWVARELRPRLSGFVRNTRDLLSYGVRVHGSDALGTLLAQIDKVILIGILAPSIFGVYVVVFNLSRLITTFASSVVPVLLPRTAGKPLAEVLATTSRALATATLLTLAAVAGFAVFGALVLRVLYGAEFGDGYWTLLILAVEAALASAAVILQQPYVVTNRAGLIVLFQIASLVVAAVLVYLLSRSFGAEGAALGMLVATALRLALVYGGYRRCLGSAAPRVVPERADWLFLASKLRLGLQ